MHITSFAHAWQVVDAQYRLGIINNLSWSGVSLTRTHPAAEAEQNDLTHPRVKPQYWKGVASADQGALEGPERRSRTSQQGVRTEQLGIQRQKRLKTKVGEILKLKLGIENG